MIPGIVVPTDSLILVAQLICKIHMVILDYIHSTLDMVVKIMRTGVSTAYQLLQYTLLIST